MNNMLTQIDDDALDQVSGGASGEVSFDPFAPFGKALTDLGNALTSIPSIGIKWSIDVFFGE